jgi:3-oxoadipate enol-lactonase
MMGTTPVGDVSFSQIGDGPDLVLLHSLLADRNVFERVVPTLATVHRVTLVDLPGYGSTKPIEVGIDNYADLVADVLTAVGAEPSSTAILGNGLGGFVALATAARYGDRFDRLVVAGAGAGFPEGGTAAFTTMIERVRSEGMEAILEIAVRRIFTEEYIEAHPAEAEGRRAVLRTADPEAFIRACQTLIDLDLRTEVSNLTNPTLIVVGSEDAATPPSMAVDLANRIPDSRLEVIPGLAHAPQLQAPDRFLDIVAPFLRR